MFLLDDVIKWFAHFDLMSVCRAITYRCACWPLRRYVKTGSLAPGRLEQNFRSVIFKLISVTDARCVSCKIALRWMPLDLNDDKSTLVQVVVWCRQATSHYLSQCWPRIMSLYGVTRPQWVKSSFITENSSLGIGCDIALNWMPQNLTNKKSTWVHVMVVYNQVTSHYLSQCRPRSMSPYGLTRPQCVNGSMIDICEQYFCIIRVMS